MEPIIALGQPGEQETAKARKALRGAGADKGPARARFWRTRTRISYRASRGFAAKFMAERSPRSSRGYAAAAIIAALSVESGKLGK